MVNKSIKQLILLGFLLILIVAGALPGYIRGHWNWETPPQVTNLEDMKRLRTTGLPLENWQITNQKILEIGGLKWLQQDLQLEKNLEKNKAILLLLPQSEITDQPQVEWTDIRGLQNWKIDSKTTIKFIINPSNHHQKVEVEANYFRSWSKLQTYAVIQWYAFPNGGHPSPQVWFWADRQAQISQQRVPWIAVSVQIFIEPLGDIAKIRPVAESLAINIQEALIKGPLAY